MATTKKGKKATSSTVRKVVKRKKPYASMTRKKGGDNEIKLQFTQRKGKGRIEKRHNYAPIGRPPSDPEARRKYDAAKRKETPYQEKLDAQKEARASRRAEARVKNAEKKAKERDARRQKRAKQGYARSRAESEKESALKMYQGWSINELRSDCKDFGISDYRRDWMKMSRDQLAVWLYKHKGSASRQFYGEW